MTSHWDLDAENAAHNEVHTVTVLGIHLKLGNLLNNFDLISETNIQYTT